MRKQVKIMKAYEIKDELEKGMIYILQGTRKDMIVSAYTNNYRMGRVIVKTKKTTYKMEADFEVKVVIYYHS